MGWGLDLWDRETEVKAHVEDGLKFIDKSRNFVLEMAKLEASFAGQMKKLVKQFMPTAADDAYSQDAAYRVRAHISRCCGLSCNLLLLLSLLPSIPAIPLRTQACPC